MSLKPIEALVKGIRNYCAHNTSVALAYISDPASFGVLPEAQRRQVHGGACSLMGLADTATAQELQAVAAQFDASGRNPRFSWVHQNYLPYSEPGKTRRPSLAVMFAQAAKQGLIVPAADFVETCKAATFDKASNPKGIILAAPRRGGYILAVKQDAEASKAERPSKGRKAEPTKAELSSYLA